MSLALSSAVLGLALLAPHPQTAHATPTAVQLDRAKLHPQMQRLLAERGPSKGWVYFADKGLHDPEALRSALALAKSELTPRARQRRSERRQWPGLVDEFDLPLARDYVEAVARTGAEVVIESTWLNAVSVRGTRAQFDAIAQLDCVNRIEPVRRGRQLGAASPTLAPTVTGPGFYGGSEAQLEQLNLPAVHARGFTGAGIVIGILDTGFHRGHEAFNQSGHVVDVLAEFDFVDGDSNTDIEAGDPGSQHSHGTYILGCMAAYLPGELVGAAYDASFILCKTEDTTNEYQQEEDFYVAGLQFIESNGGDLATSSLGYIDWYTQSDLDGVTAVTTLGVNVATANGMHCLTAAGNAGNDSDPGTSTLIAPADALQVLTCGAVDSTGTIASFSSSGPTADGRVKPEILATGVSTATVCAFTDVDCTSGVSGTSLSTPLLAGMVACLTQAHPNWTVAQMRDRILRFAGDFATTGTTDPLFIRGYGIPDALLTCIGKLDTAAVPSLAGGGPSITLPFTAAPGPSTKAVVTLDVPPSSPGGMIPVIVVTDDSGQVIGTRAGKPTLSGEATTEVTLPLPREHGLDGRDFHVRGGFLDPATGRLIEVRAALFPVTTLH